MKLRLLSLFAGIGGFDLGAEMTGRFETVAFCEINPFARAVLAKHWPNVPCFPDVTKLTKDQINGPIDAICAGFPCQDLSFAGKGAGIEGARSGLWSEVVRLVGEIRPAIVMLENVPAILVRGLGRVLSDLAKIGYNAFWDCIRASDLGAWHRRDRWFLVAYPKINNGNVRADSHIASQRIMEATARRSSGVLSNSIGIGQPRQGPFGYAGDQEAGRDGQATDAVYGRFGDFWSTEPNVGRVADGVPNRTHRLAALGNAIVPLWAFLVSKVAIAIYDQDNGLAISTPDPRAVTGKNACAALRGVKLVPDPFFIVADQAQDSAPSYSNNLCISCEGLPCAIPPGAQLTGRGISNRSQSFSLQSGDHFPNELASGFPSQFVAPSNCEIS